MPATPEGLLHTLDLANASREQLYRKRTEVISNAISGKISIIEAMENPSVRRMRAFSFLKRLPRIGSQTARAILREVNVSETQRLSATGPRQRQRMVELISTANPRGRR